MKKLLAAVIGFCIGFFTMSALSGCGQTVIQGPPGLSGKDGQSITGAIGPTGQGLPGSPCSVSTLPVGALISCGDGSKAIVYNGTIITSVPVCPQQGLTVYPNNFVEQLFCIQDSLYGVYYDKDYAFEALVVPGVYKSTAPKGCTFRVKEHCSIEPV